MRWLRRFRATSRPADITIENQSASVGGRGVRDFCCVSMAIRARGVLPNPSAWCGSLGCQSASPTAKDHAGRAGASQHTKGKQRRGGGRQKDERGTRAEACADFPAAASPGCVCRARRPLASRWRRPPTPGGQWRQEVGHRANAARILHQGAPTQLLMSPPTSPSCRCSPPPPRRRGLAAAPAGGHAATAEKQRPHAAHNPGAAHGCQE